MLNTYTDTTWGSDGSQIRRNKSRTNIMFFFNHFKQNNYIVQYYLIPQYISDVYWFRIGILYFIDETWSFHKKNLKHKKKVQSTKKKKK